MKRTFFNPAMVRFVDPITGKQSRSSRTRFGAGCYRSDAGGGDDDDDEEDDDDEDEQKPKPSKESKLLMKRISKMLSTRVQKEDLKDINAFIEKAKDLPLEALRALAKDDDTGILKIVQKQGEEITKLKQRSAQMSEEPMSVRMEIRSQIKKFLEDPNNKSAIENFRNGQSKSLGADPKDGTPNIEIKLSKRAAATMMVSTSLGSSAFLPMPAVIPGVTDIASNQPFMEDYFNTTTINSPRIVYTQKTNRQGNATFLAEGSVKQLVSFELATSESYAKKVADKIKLSTEMWEDVDYIAGEIENELKYQVDIKVDASLLSGGGDGTASATDLKGLVSYVGGYILTNIATTTPNNYDAVRAAIAQIVSLNFVPTIVFYNPIDGANMDLVKDANGRPLWMEYKTQDGKLYRLQVVETNQMPAGNVLVADRTKFRIYNYKPFRIAFGWVNDDFEKNLFTVIGERRLHAFVKSNEVGAFVYDTFANIKTAITAA